MKVQKKGVFRVSCDTINISLKKFGPYIYICSKRCDFGVISVVCFK